MTDVMRSQYRRLTEREQMVLDNIKQLGGQLHEEIESLGARREYSIAKTKLEEAVMWATKGLTSG